MLNGKTRKFAGGDYCQRPGEQDDPQLCGLHRHGEAHRGRCQEPGQYLIAVQYTVQG